MTEMKNLHSALQATIGFVEYSTLALYYFMLIVSNLPFSVIHWSPKGCVYKAN